MYICVIHSQNRSLLLHFTPRNALIQAMITSRRPLIPKALVAWVALICLCWHLLLPLFINLGIAPVIYGLSEHCRTLLTTSDPVASTAKPAVPAMDMAMPGMDMSHMDMSTMPMDMTHASSAAPLSTNAESLAREAHIHDVMTLAAKIMKHCPLCSHGLEGGLLPTLVILSLVLLLLRLVELPVLLTLYRTAILPVVAHIRPQAQAPPVFA